jgi:hypothetical protein
MLYSDYGIRKKYEKQRNNNETNGEGRRGD